MKFKKLIKGEIVKGSHYAKGNNGKLYNVKKTLQIAIGYKVGSNKNNDDFEFYKKILY